MPETVLLSRVTRPELVVAALVATVLGGPRSASADGLKGVVLDRQGRAVEGASIYVEADPNRPTDEVAARTDEAGAFEVRRAPAARVMLRVWHPQFAPALVPEVRTEAAEPLRITLSPGARLEGVVSHRDGRAFTGGRVIVQSAAPAAVYGPPQRIVPDGEGVFVSEHLPPGPARVFVLAFTPQRAPPGAGAVTTLSPIATAAAVLQDGETTKLAIDLRDVLVSGRVTRGGAGLAGVRVTFSGPPRSISFPRGAQDAPAAPTGLPMLSAVTRDDGTYDLVAFEPGPARVDLRDSRSGAGLAVRQVEVDDADRFAFDVEITEARVAGVVARKEDGGPLGEVALRLAPADGRPGVPAQTRSRPDGGFALGAEPGEYVLTAELPGRVRVERPLRVAGDGVADLRLEMDRGLAIVGRVLDGRGRPVPSLLVFASGADGVERALTGRDGTFRIEGLTDRPYALSAGSGLSGFAVQPDTRPGLRPLSLALRPGGTLSLRVLSTAGQPVAEAVVSVLAVGGVRVDPSLCVSAPTGADGTTVVTAPEGDVVLAVVGETGGRALRSVAVRSGQAAAVQLRLETAPPHPDPSP